MNDVMTIYLPNRQTKVKWNFAYLALAPFARLANHGGMDDNLPLPNNIKALREKAELTLEELAEKSGLSVSYLSRLEAGKRNLSVKNINKIAPSLGASGPELVATTHKSQRIKISGVVQAGDYIDPGDEIYLGDESVDIPMEERLQKFRLYALRVAGPSMNVRYPEGSILICASLADTQELPIPGKRYIVRRIRPDGSYEQTVKEFVVDSSGKKWLMPRSTEPQWQSPIPYEDGSEDETVELQSRVLYSVMPE